MNKNPGPIIVEQSFNSAASEVWKAITNHQQMIQWYFEMIPDFKPEVGFETEFYVKSGDRNFHHQWKVLEVIPNKKISYTWTYPDFPGDGKVTFEISEKGKKAKLKLTAEGLHTFPQDIPEFKRESCIGGWEYFIQGRLKDYLSKS